MRISDLGSASAAIQQLLEERAKKIAAELTVKLLKQYEEELRFQLLEVAAGIAIDVRSNLGSPNAEIAIYFKD